MSALEPRIFSFNNPAGALPEMLTGLGERTFNLDPHFDHSRR